MWSWSGSCGPGLERFGGEFMVLGGLPHPKWGPHHRLGSHTSKTGGWRGTENSNRMRRDTRRKGFRFQWMGLKDYNRVWGLAYNTSAPRVETHASFLGP